MQRGWRSRPCSPTASCTAVAQHRPHRKDGAYKAFLDTPASIWWKNWRTGDEGTWTYKSEKELTAVERDALCERIRAIKAHRETEQLRRWQAAAKLATSIWCHAKPAGDDHPYLQRKEVPAIGLRQTEDGRLIVPVLNQSGKIQSLQFILREKPAEGTDKLFLTGGKTSGGFSPFQQKTAPKTARYSLPKATPQEQVCIWPPDTPY